jgi:outer membrane protein TolC
MEKVVPHVFPVVHTLIRLVAAALLLAGSASLGAQQADALSINEALRLAAQRSQQLLAQDAAAAAAREMATAAAQGADPTLTAGISNLPIDGPDALSLTRDFMTMRSIGLMREFTRRNKLDARAARFEREAEAADTRRMLALADLRRGTAIAWFDRYYRERARDVLGRQRDDAALLVEAADLAFRTGLGPLSDVFAARSSLAEIEDRLATNERDVEVATIKLARWIGDAAARPLAEPPATDTISLDRADLETQIAHHPQIQLMLKQEEIARAEADIARASKRSDWTVELMYSERGPEFPNMMSLNVSKPLQWRERNRQDRELAAKLAMAEARRAEREEETRAHVAEAHALLQAWQRNRERLDRYTSTLIPLAGERTLAATAAYRGGRGTLDAVLKARVDELDTRLDQLMLEMETAQLWAEINYLIPVTPDAGAHE